MGSCIDGEMLSHTGTVAPPINVQIIYVKVRCKVKYKDKMYGERSR